MASDLELVIGADGAWELTIADALGTPIGTYTSAATLDISCWPGDDQPELFMPDGTWIDPTAGTIRMAISAGQTAGLAPGTYSLMLSIMADGQVARKTLPNLLLLPAPGATAARRMYCTVADMVSECSWIERIPGRRSSGPPNFLRERAQASELAEQEAQARATRKLIDQLRRHRPVIAVPVIPPTTGLDAGPDWGDSTIPDLDLLDADLSIANAIVANGLMTDYPPDMGRLRRMTACRALYLAMDQAAGSLDGDQQSSLQKLAATYRTRAIRMQLAWTAYVDSDADGVPNAVLGL